MNNKLNIILALILILEFILQFLFSCNYISLGISGFIFVSLFLFSKYFYRTKKKLPWFYLSGLIFALNSIVLSNLFQHYLLNLLITYHAILLALNWSDTEISVSKSNTKRTIDVGINRYSICFISIIISVYLAMSGSSTIVKPIYFDCIGFLLLGLNLFLLMISYVLNRFKNFAKSVNLVFSSTVIAVLILLISGPYVISTFTPNLLVVPKQNSRTSSETPFKKTRKPKNNKQEVGYTNDLTLTKKTDISQNHIADVFLKLDSVDDKVFLKPGKIYLRGAGFDTYLDNKWVNYYDNSQWFEDGVDNSADGVIRLQETPKNLHAIKHSVYLLNGGHGNIIALPNISEIYMDKILVEENETYFLPILTGNQISYKLTSAYTTYEHIDKRNLVHGKKSKKYLSILGTVGAKIRDTTLSLFNNEKTDVDKIESILYYFRQNYRYSLVTHNEQDIDPLENFFYHEKVGHCELYATAMVLMLRSAGIPARLCVGYCGGAYNQTMDAYVFYADEAHAWAEVYFDGYGWVVLDSTPSSAVGAAEIDDDKSNQGIEFNSSHFMEFGPNTEKINKSKIDKGLLGMLEVLFLSASKDPMLMVNLILLTYPISFFFILGILKILRYKRRRQKAEILSSPDFIKEIYKKFGQKPKGQTFLEYLDKLKEKQSVKNELDEIMNYFYEISYGKSNRDNEHEKNVILEISKLKKPVKIVPSGQ